MSFKISFCTTCMGRTHHLKATLPHNLREIAQHWPNTEITLLNYNSNDGLHEWITGNFRAEIEYGILRYYRTSQPRYFYMSHAKNASHILSTGDVLFNLDADNFIDRNLVTTLFKLFKTNPDIVVRGHPNFGVGGRLAVARKNFFKLNGYNESFIGWGEEDREFFDRTQMLGLQSISIRDFDSCITHGDQERLALLPPDSFIKSKKFDFTKYASTHVLALNPNLNRTWLKNYFISKYGIGRQGYKVNLSRHWGFLDQRFLAKPAYAESY